MVRDEARARGGTDLEARTRPPLLRGGRVLKRWRGIALWCGDLSLRAVRSQIGPLHQQFWAVWDRSTGRLWQSAASAHRCSVLLSSDRLVILGGEVGVDLALTGIHQAPCGWPGGYEQEATPWTCRQGVVRASGAIRLGADERRVEASALRDDLAGYPGRRTTWRWSGGAGCDAAGRAVLWGAIVGPGDDPARGGTLVWHGGRVGDAGSARIADDLTSFTLAGGGAVGRGAEARHGWDDAFLTTRATARHAFGRFDVTLPGGWAVHGAAGLAGDYELRW
jgi:hypothetical protein